MPVERDEFRYLEKEVKDLRELVEALRAENERLSNPQPIETIPSPPVLTRYPPKKKRVRKATVTDEPTESDIPLPSGEPEPPTDGEPSELLIHFPADPLFGSEPEPPSPATL